MEKEGGGEEVVTELTVFKAEECYVYQIPPASSLGHRAELWGINDWLKAVNCKVVTIGDDLFVRLLDQETKDLFAECPIRSETVIHRCIEPVVDSSRYFCIRLEDRASKQHAFVGLGFRERAEASAFKAALDDQRQYIRRKHEAEIISEEIEHVKHGDVPARDFRLKEGEKISMKLAPNAIHREAGAASHHVDHCNITAIATASGFKLVPPPAPVTKSTPAKPGPPALAKVSGEVKAPSAAAAGAGDSAGAAAGGDAECDDWGDFVG